ncbi:hypothetical protein [Sphingosinicella soli]|uniref:Uncharacterized protein n=1 Tax=Sphingosinicella soli TaxID=333708 RepID=A0A7W7B349_9SPHN|nr:hypothetical protein [Sphingosinicella soli]MBB4633133.1 hypothetical protein [Sphingosinicella soli]
MLASTFEDYTIDARELVISKPPLRRRRFKSAVGFDTRRLNHYMDALVFPLSSIFPFKLYQFDGRRNPVPRLYVIALQMNFAQLAKTRSASFGDPRRDSFEVTIMRN